jgi:hypothetical protein
MNAWGRHGLAMTLALSSGAWCAAQSTPPQTPAQTQQTPTSTPAQPQTQAPDTTQPQTAPSSTSQQPPAGTTNNGAQPPQQHTIQMVQAQAQLDKTIDSKKAKQGDPVTAKLVANVQIPNEQELPKNTVLEGHVDQVTASQNKSDSTVVVTFDKAKLKGGQELPIKATILAMAEPAVASPDAGGGAPPAGGAAPAGGGGGGMAGGGGGAAHGGSAGSGESTASAPSTSSMPDASSGGGGQQQAQMSKVPDVNLTSDIHQHNSATFTSKGKNVHVPDGTEMELAITVIPAGVRLQ